MYELPPNERPDDAVIDDDGELDAWYEKFVRERERAFGQKPKDIGEQAIPFYNSVPTG